MPISTFVITPPGCTYNWSSCQLLDIKPEGMATYPSISGDSITIPQTCSFKFECPESMFDSL